MLIESFVNNNMSKTQAEKLDHAKKFGKYLPGLAEESAVLSVNVAEKNVEVSPTEPVAEQEKQQAAETVNAPTEQLPTSSVPVLVDNAPASGSSTPVATPVGDGDVKPKVAPSSDKPCWWQISHCYGCCKPEGSA